MRRPLLLATMALASLQGCDDRPPPPPAPVLEREPTPTPQMPTTSPSDPAVPPGSAAPATTRLVPLHHPDWLIDLQVAGFGDANVALPRGATTPRATLVALHGYGDRPDWQCGAWTGIAQSKVFVLCPRGIALPAPVGNFGFGSVEETRREVQAGLEALRERFEPYLTDDVILVGFSLGAQRAAHLAASDPTLFPRVALVEGGTKSWTRKRAREFRDGGGKRILFVCSQPGCRRLVQALSEYTAGHATQARGVYLGSLGHHLGPSVTRQLKEPWDWLIADQPEP